MNVTHDDLIMLIGRQQVEIAILRAQVAALADQLKAAAPKGEAQS